MWANKFAQKFKTFGSDLSDEVSVASTNSSNFSRKSHPPHAPRRGVLPVVSEDVKSAAGSDITFEPFVPSKWQTQWQSPEQSHSPDTVPNSEAEAQLQEKDLRIRELEKLQQLDQEELRAIRKELQDVKFKYLRESQEWKLDQEMYLSQTAVLTERIEAYDRDLNDEGAMNTIAQGIVEEDSDSEEESLEADGARNKGFSFPGFGRKNSTDQEPTANKKGETPKADNSDYIAKLQGKLCRATHNLKVMENQMELLEKGLEEEARELKMKLKHCQQAMSMAEADFDTKLSRAEYEKKRAEQRMMSTLEIKQEKIRRLEETLDELEDAASRKKAGTLNMEEFASIVSLNILKEQFDSLSKTKDEMEAEFVSQLENYRREIKRLQAENEKKQKLIARLEKGDVLAALENDFDTATVTTSSRAPIAMPTLTLDDSTGQPKMKGSKKSSEATNQAQTNGSQEDLSVDSIEEDDDVPRELGRPEADDDINDQISVVTSDLFLEDRMISRRKLHVVDSEQQHTFDKQEFQRKAAMLQEQKLAELDETAQKQRKLVLNRFL